MSSLSTGLSLICPWKKKKKILHLNHVVLVWPTGGAAKGAHRSSSSTITYNTIYVIACQKMLWKLHQQTTVN